MVYENPTNITGLVEMFQYAERVTNHVFVYSLLFSLYLIILIYSLTRRDNWMEAGIVAGFGVSITAILLRVANILTVDWVIYLCVLSIVVPFIFAMAKN